MGPETWRVVSRVVLIVAGIYVAYGAILVIFQSNLVYYPVRGILATPEHAGLSYEAISLWTTDNVRISAWYVPAEHARGVLLFCHGNGGNISHRLESIQVFHRLGLDVFIFDYRGYGQSEGKPGEKGTYLDAEAAWNHLVQERGVEPSDIILFGRSLGGAVCAWLAQAHTPGALILESTFTSVPDMAARMYPIYPVRLLTRFRYDARRYLPQAGCPVLVVHSRGDELVPFSHGQALFEAAQEPKEFLEISGTHNEGFITSGKLYQDGLEAFISKHLKR